MTKVKGTFILGLVVMWGAVVLCLEDPRTVVQFHPFQDLGPHFAVSFRRDIKSHCSLQSGIYANRIKISFTGKVEMEQICRGLSN